MKKFTYFVPTHEYECCGSLEYEGYDVEYEVSYKDVKKALVDILADDRDLFPKDLDRKLVETFAKNYVEKLSDADLLDGMADYYEEELKDYFEEEALA